MFRYQIDKLAELNNIIIGCVLSTQKLKVKKQTICNRYALEEIVYSMLNLLMFFLIN